VSWIFSRKGAIAVKGSPREDELMEKALEAGAEDVLGLGSEGFEVRTDAAQLHTVAAALERAGVRLGEQRWIYVPQNTVKLEGEGARKMLKLMDMLEDNDDVQNIHANFEIDDALLQQLS
jgi:transcriptional/translational regulatory protein YebC/TACO1